MTNPILTKKQSSFIKNAKKRFNLKQGARRCGKTHLDIFYRIPAKIMNLRSELGLYVILGVSRETIERNVLKPMRDLYSEELVGPINNRNIAMIFGEEVYCLGADNSRQVAKIQGSSIKYCYCDELAKLHPAVFEMVKGSLDKEYSQLDAALNPEGENHWLKKNFIDKIEEDKLDVYLQKYTIYDNPFLPEIFVENFVKEMKSAGNHWYRRLVLGEWCNAEGLVYPAAQAEGVFIDDEELPEEFEEYCVSCDYGIANATVFILYGRSEGIWYGLKVFYHSGRESNEQKTDEEYADHLIEFCKGLTVKKGNDLYVFAGDLKEGEVDENYKKSKELFGDLTSPIKKILPMYIQVIIDPSALSFITAIKRKRFFKTKKADNSVEDGIRNTSNAIYSGLLKFSKSCKKIKQEFDGYVWDDKSQEDKPIKENDHCMDAVRYAVQTRKMYQEYKEWKF